MKLAGFAQTRGGHANLPLNKKRTDGIRRLR
jgi:hypothetical protein